MSQRPQFWIHRTRLFWFGLGLLVGLTVLMVVLCWHGAEVKYTNVTRTTRTMAVFSNYLIGFEQGGIAVQRTKGEDYLMGSSPARASGWSYQLRARVGFRWMPDVDSRGSGYGRGFSKTLFVPLWPFIVLLGILWPYWMHRSEKKMVERYRKMGVMPDVG